MMDSWITVLFSVSSMKCLVPPFPFSALYCIIMYDGRLTIIFSHCSDEPSLSYSSVPSVPRAVGVYSTSFTSVEVTWMEPAVFFRELMHNYCRTAAEQLQL